MFKVKAIVTGFGKDESKNPCHFRYKVGDEIVFDGEAFIGRVCPNMMVPFSQAFMALFASGGRHKEGEAPGSYYPFWHSPQSLYDPVYRKYDGVGFRPTLAIVRLFLAIAAAAMKKAAAEISPGISMAPPGREVCEGSVISFLKSSGILTRFLRGSTGSGIRTGLISRTSSFPPS